MRSPKSSCKKGRDVIRIKCTAIRPGSVSRRLSKEFGQKSLMPAQKPHLTPLMKKKRRDFYKHHHHWNFAECKKVPNTPCNKVYLATSTLYGHWVKVLTRNVCSHNETPAEPNDLGCYVVPWCCWSVVHSA